MMANNRGRNEKKNSDSSSKGLLNDSPQSSISDDSECPDAASYPPSYQDATDMASVNVSNTSSSLPHYDGHGNGRNEHETFNSDTCINPSETLYNASIRSASTGFSRYGDTSVRTASIAGPSTDPEYMSVCQDPSYASIPINFHREPPILRPPSLPNVPPPPPPNGRAPSPLSNHPQLPLPSSRTRPTNRRQRYGSHRTHTGNRPCMLRRRNLLIMALCSIALSFACVICLIFGVDSRMQGSQSWEDRPLPENVFETCLECVSLLDKPQATDEENEYLVQLHRKSKGSKDYCCARTSKELNSLIYLLARQQKHLIALEKDALKNPERQKSRIPPHVQFTPVSVHKRLLPFKETDLRNKKLGVLSRLTFDVKNHERWEHVRNVTVGKNMLAISYSGWYYIYSSVRFRLDKTEKVKCNTADRQTETWAQEIRHYWFDRKSEGTIAKATTQCCVNCSTYDTTTYTGGVFRLTRGDILHVRVTGKGLSLDDEDASYMGLFMLGSAEGGKGQIEDKVLQQTLNQRG